jgi:hypothetical protein
LKPAGGFLGKPSGTAERRTIPTIENAISIDIHILTNFQLLFTLIKETLLSSVDGRRVFRFIPATPIEQTIHIRQAALSRCPGKESTTYGTSRVSGVKYSWQAKR